MKAGSPAKKKAHRSHFSLLRFSIFALGVIILDQLTKLAIVMNVYWEKGDPTYFFNSEHAPIPVIDNFFYIVHITNEGAAWGILSGQTYLLTSVAIIVLMGMWLFRKHLGVESTLVQIAMGLFVGGIIGNLIDRISYGHVIDFLDVHLPIVNYRWPAFNVADCAISIGVTLYIFYSLFLDGKDKPRKKSSSKEA